MPDYTLPSPALERPFRVIEENSAGFSITMNEFVERQLALMSPTAAKLYIGLRYFTNINSGRCFPSRSTLAKLTGMSLPTISKAKIELTELGIIRVEENFIHGPDPEKKTERVVDTIFVLDGMPKNSSPGVDKSFTQGGGKDFYPGVDKSFSPNKNQLNKNVKVLTNVSSGASAPRSETAAQLKKKAENQKRLSYWRAYLGGLGLEENSAPASALKGPAMKAITAAVLNDAALNPAKLARLTHWAAGSYAWRDNAPPSFVEIVKAMPSWIAAGEPRDYTPPPKQTRFGQPEPPPRVRETLSESLARIKDPAQWSAKDRQLYNSPGGDKTLASDVRRIERMIEEGQSS